MTPQEKDRIQNAINHIKTSVDVDPWAMEIAVEAMQRQILEETRIYGTCPVCRRGFVIDWSESE